MIILRILHILVGLIVTQSFLFKSSSVSYWKVLNSIKPTKFQEDLINKENRRNLRGLTITGDTITPCRPFNVAGIKEVVYIDSYLEFKSIPKFNVPEIAILGRSNVGKSSLLNMLAGAHKNTAVVSKMPGRTRCVNLFQCSDIKGPFAMLVDLPGYGFARMSKEMRGDISAAALAYLRRRRSLVAALLLIDCRRGYQESDISLMETLDSLAIPYSVVVTKVDKLSSVEFEKCSTDVKTAVGESSNFPVVMSSSQTGFGKKEIWSTIKHHMMSERKPVEEVAEEAPKASRELGEERHYRHEHKKKKYDPAASVEWYPGD